MRASLSWLSASLLVPLVLAGCTDDTPGDTTMLETTSETGDGDGDPGDGDGAPGDGDGDGAGDGDGEPDPALCGNGIVEADEACDDGNPLNTDDCLNTCELPSCGDGFAWEGVEDCDDANADNNDACLDTCVAASCGDGYLWNEQELCEDDNAVGGDGCSETCEIELYWRCVGIGPDSCQPIRILWTPAYNDDMNYRAAIAAVTGGPVDYLSAAMSVPVLGDLLDDYDCVFTHSYGTYMDAAALGTALANFVDGGGNVVLGIGVGIDPPYGLRSTAIMADGYAPVVTGGSVGPGNLSSAGDGMTILHTNVGDYASGYAAMNVALQGEGLQDGSYTNGSIAVAYRPDFKVVYIQGSGAGGLGSGDWATLTANACAAGFVQ